MRRTEAQTKMPKPTYVSSHQNLKGSLDRVVTVRLLIMIVESDKIK